MDEHKNFKRRHRRPASLDGFISDGRQLGAPVGRVDNTGGLAISPTLGGALAGTDGFRPLRQAPRDLGHTPESEETAALLNEPILLPDDFAGKKRHFVRPRWRARRRLKRAVTVFMALVFVAAAYFGVKLYITERHLFRGGGRAPALASSVDINQLKGEGDGRINILLLGIGGAGHSGPDLTDSIMLVSIDPINHKMALLSVPRDLCVKLPCTANQKINAAYALAKESSSAKSSSGQIQAGLDAIDSTLSPVLGIPIHYHAVIDFKAFQQGVDAVGGVDVNVPANLTANENFWIEGTSQHYQLNVPAGEQHFNGMKALYYARERHNDSDFARSQRQRLLFSALKDKALSVGTFSNPVRISNLLSTLGDNVYTDFSVNDMTRLYQIIQQIPSSSISSLDLITPPHDFLTTGMMNGYSIVEPKAGLFNYSAINNYVRNTLKDSFIAKENASIAVYNATDITGLAGSSAEVLKSYGYNVTTVDNAPKTTNSAATTVVDLSKGADKYTRHYLEERYKTKAVTKMPSGSGISPPAGTTFVIILGRDAAS